MLAQPASGAGKPGFDRAHRKTERRADLELPGCREVEYFAVRPGESAERGIERAHPFLRIHPRRHQLSRVSIRFRRRDPGQCLPVPSRGTLMVAGQHGGDPVEPRQRGLHLGPNLGTPPPGLHEHR